MPSPLPTRTPSYWVASFELVLVIVACVLLWHIARGLADDASLVWTPLQWRQMLPTTLVERTDWLNSHIGEALAILGLSGWAALWLGRLRIGMQYRLAAILSLWLLAGAAVAAGVGRIPLAPAKLALVASCLAGIGLSWAALGAWLDYRARIASAAVLPVTPLSACIYPGWLFIGGLGVLWLLDYAARGYLKYRHIGVYQFDALLLATALFTLVAAAAPAFLAGMSRQLARIEGNKGSSIFPILIILAVWIVVITVLALRIPLAERPVALITESLRLAAWVGMAWFTYRWVGTGLRPATGILAATTLLALLLPALWLLEDRGPILVQAIALSLVLGSLVMAPLRQRTLPLMATLVALALVMAALAGIAWSVYHFAPPLRLVAIENLGQGQLEYLSENRWFIRHSPVLGHGLGKTPWCGHAGSLGVAGCAGVAQQIQSDYVFAALSGVWGALPATLLIFLLLGWLTLLIHSRFSQASARAVDLNTLAGWLIAAGGLTYAVQIIVSSLGTLGAIPLTGISIPLLAYGGTSLFSLALLAGLAINAFPQPHH